MWYPRISKLATSSIFKRFTCKTHPTLNRNACFSSLKSPSISSKNGYTNYSNNLYLVKHYHKSGIHKWYKNLLKTTRNTYKYYDQQTQKVISSPRVGFAILKRIIFPLFSVYAGLVIVGVYVRFFEKIPYTNRTHIVFAPSYFDKIAGDFFLHQKVQLQILSKEHPDSVRVKMIGEQIVQALESDLKAMKNKNVSIDHLKGLIWEFVVVDQPIGGAGSLPGGKILVSTDLLKELKSDADIATIIGHQVGHIVARHGANAMNMTMLVFQTKVFLELAGMAEILAKIVDYNPHGASNWIKDIFDYPKRQRQESEADHIGLLVKASAGYDPQVAPKVYEILEKYESSGTDNFHIYPSAKKRAEKLARGNVMKDASSMYSKVIKTRVDVPSVQDQKAEDEVNVKTVSKSKKEKPHGFLKRSRNVIMGAAGVVRRAATSKSGGEDSRLKIEAAVLASNGMIYCGCTNGLIIH